MPPARAARLGLARARSPASAWAVAALLAAWERGEPSPLEAPLPLIDWGRLGIFGHSRGGEAARAAYQFIVDPAYWSSQPLLDRLGPDVAAELRVLAILEIGAVDYNGRETNLDERTFDAPGAAWVALSLIHISETTTRYAIS